MQKWKVVKTKKNSQQRQHNYNHVARRVFHRRQLRHLYLQKVLYFILVYKFELNQRQVQEHHCSNWFKFWWDI